MTNEQIEIEIDKANAEQARFRDWYSEKPYANPPCLKEFQIWLAAKQDAAEQRSDSEESF